MNKLIINFGNDDYTVETTLTRDGNRWCILYGENLQEGVCGFGKHIHEAIVNFKIIFRND